MGSGPRGAAQDYIGNQSNKINTQHDDLQKGLQSSVTGAQKTYQDQMTNAQNSINSITPDKINAMFSPSTSAWSGLAGGVNNINPDAMRAFNAAGGRVNQSMDDFQSIFDKPISDQDRNTMLANGTFQKFIDTGGYSDKDIQNLRARSLSPLVSTFSNANNEINRTRSLQGGYSPNTTAALAANARNLGYGAADASTNVEAGLADSIRQGKEWGATGMSNAGTSIADLTLRGKTAGAQGLASTALAEQQAQKSIMDLDAEMKRSGAAGLSDDEKSALMGQLTASANQGNLASLASGQLNNANTNLIHNQDTQTNANLGLTNDQLQSFNLPTGFQSTMGNINSIIGTGGKIASGIAGGFGNFGSQFRATNNNPQLLPPTEMG